MSDLKNRDELKQRSHDLDRVVELLQDVAVLANQAGSVRSALRQTLGLICQKLGWPLGHAYLKDGKGDGFVSSRIWYVEEETPADELRRAIEKVGQKPGSGLIGQVILTGQPDWSGDIREAERSLGARHLDHLTIRSVYAFPILIKSSVVGVLEFFCCEELEPDPVVLDGLKEVGTQLGRVFERRSLSERLEARTIEDQRRIAQELHDTIGQQLSAVAMLLKSVEKKVGRQEPPPESLLKKAVTSLEEARKDVRRLARGLIPLEIDRLGLPGALAELADNVSSLYGVTVSTDCSEDVSAESDFVATTLYQIAQEMLQNAVTHSQSERIRISLRDDRPSGGIRLSVRDFGVGLTGEPSGTGFQIMHYRAGLIDGTIQVKSETGRGTEVTCHVLSDA